MDRGVYDAAELAHLLGHDVDWVVRWSTPSGGRPAIVPPTFERAFSFTDLVSFRTAQLIRSMGVSDQALRTGLAVLRVQTQSQHPLASRAILQQLATSGASFLADVAGEGYEDIGRAGQVFQDAVRIYLAKIEFDPADEPTAWRPADGVRIDPRIQAGAPCVDGTRIPTATVATMLVDDAGRRGT